MLQLSSSSKRLLSEDTVINGLLSEDTVINGLLSEDTVINGLLSEDTVINGCCRNLCRIIVLTYKSFYLLHYF